MIHGLSVSFRVLVVEIKSFHTGQCDHLPPTTSLVIIPVSQTGGILNHGGYTEQTDISTLRGFTGYFYIRSQAAIDVQINGRGVIRFGKDHPVKENHIQGRRHHDEKSLRDYNILSSYSGSIHRYSAKRALSWEIIIWVRSPHSSL